MLGYKKIDGEYCDIVFNDKDHQLLDEFPVHHKDFIAERDYIDLDEGGNGQNHEKNLFQKKRKRENALEVALTLNGSLLAVYYLPVKKKKTYFARSFSSDYNNEETVIIASLEGYEKFPLIEIEKGEVRIKQPPCFSGRYLGKNGGGEAEGRSFKLDREDVLSLERGNLQVFFRHSKMPLPLKADQFVSLGENENKTVGKVFGALMSAFLLLLLVDASKREAPKKKAPVIYRAKAIPRMPKKVRELDPVPRQKKAQASQKNRTKPKTNKAAPAKKRLAEKKKNIKKQGVLAKKIAPLKRAKAPPPRKAPIKSYSFSSRGKLKNLFEAAKSAQNKGKRLYKNTTSVRTESSSLALSRNLSDRKLASSGKSRKLDMGMKGKYNFDTGSQGLSLKRGVSSMAISEQTRVLRGSIDPELIRRLIREYMPQFRHCYQQELVFNNKAKGVVDVMFRISSGGAISNIRVGERRGQIFTEKGVKCLGQVLALIEFPSPKGGGVVDVKQPLNFVSRD